MHTHVIIITIAVVFPIYSASLSIKICLDDKHYAGVIIIIITPTTY